MKNIYFILFFIALVCNAQVGINSNDPKATIHVAATSGNNSVVDGIIPPKLSGDELYTKRNNYKLDQKGTVVYVTAAATTPQGPTAHVTNKGYYYYDGTKWIRFGNYIGKDVLKTNSNIYTEDGLLNENRTVSMANFGMFYEFDPKTSKVSFSVDQGTFVANVKDNFIGMGTLTPSARLHINGVANTIDPLLKIDKLATTNSKESYVQRNNTYNLITDEEGNVLKNAMPISGETTSNKPYTINEVMTIATTPVILPDFTHNTALSLNFIVGFNNEDSSTGLLYSQMDFSVINKFKVRTYTSTMNVTTSGDQTDMIIFDIKCQTSSFNTQLVFKYVKDSTPLVNNEKGHIEIYRVGGTRDLDIHFWNSIKIR